MSEFITYKNGRLHVEGVDVTDIAEKVGTPFYVYSSAAMVSAFQRLRDVINHPRVKIFYAVKANSNIAVLKTLYRAGAGMDIVSGGEMKRALAAGIPGSAMVFSGVGKTEEEIRFALEKGIYQFNAESLPEIATINRVAGSMGKRAPLALRINPDVDAQTHAKIATGKEENKFGINWDHVLEACRMVAESPHLNFVGITTHIGSQITDLDPFRTAYDRVDEMVAMLRNAGGLDVQRVSLGGGLGIPYQGHAIPLEAYGRLVHETAELLGATLELEPGRFLVGEAGALVTRVIHVKKGTAKNFVVVDAAMNDLIRPTLYEAFHPIQPVLEAGSGKTLSCDVVGPVCETGDYLGLDRQLPPLKSGDLLAVLCAGAYGASMASTYNSRSLVPEILVSGDKYGIIRPALTIEKQLAWEYIPEWV